MVSSPSYDLEAVTTSDLSILAEIETEAIQPQTLNTVFFQNWADTKIQAKFFQSALEGSLGKPDVHLIKAVNSITGVIDGYMLWKIEESPESRSAVDSRTSGSAEKYTYTTPPEVSSNPSDVLNQAFVSLAISETQQLKARLLGGRKSAYVNKLFVRPGAQKHGIGSLLIEWALEKADAEGLDTYLISVPRPHEFYLSRGFHDVDFWDVDLSPWGPKYGGFGVFRFWGMGRVCGGKRGG